MIEGLRLNEHELEEKLIRETEVKKEEVVEMREKERLIVKLEQEVKNGNTVIDLMKKSANSQLEEYRRLSNENLELKLQKDRQIEKIGELLNNINLQNSRESSITSDLNYALKKIETL